MEIFNTLQLRNPFLTERLDRADGMSSILVMNWSQQVHHHSDVEYPSQLEVQNAANAELAFIAFRNSSLSTCIGKCGIDKGTRT